MTDWADSCIAAIQAGFVEAADPEKAAGMESYMRNRFEFFGIAAKDRRGIVSAALTRAGKPAESDVTSLAGRCYTQPQREFHYAGVQVMRRYVKQLTPDSVPVLEHLVITYSWWDTVDELASHVAGGLVSGYPELVSVMDDWARSGHLWRGRTAILHQLRYKERTDADRLFGYCLENASEQDFFYRKAIGWALREYSKTDPDAVADFCAEHESELSSLSLREARKYL